MVSTIIPDAKGRVSGSLKGFPNWLDRDGGIWADDEDIAYRTGSVRVAVHQR